MENLKYTVSQVNAKPMNNTTLQDIRLWFLTHDSAVRSLLFVANEVYKNDNLILSDLEMDDERIKKRVALNFFDLLYDFDMVEFIREALRWKICYGFVPLIVTMGRDGKVNVMVYESAISDNSIGSGSNDSVIQSSGFGQTAGKFFVTTADPMKNVFQGDVILQIPRPKESSISNQLVNSTSNKASIAWKQINNPMITEGQWLLNYIWSGMTPDYVNPIPKTPIMSLFMETRDVNYLLEFQRGLFLNQAKYRLIYESLPIAEPSVDRLAAAQLQDFDVQLRDLKSRDGWRQDVELTAKVRELESMKASQLMQIYDSSKPGGAGEKTVVSTDNTVFHFVPATYKLSANMQPYDITNIMQNTYNRKDYLNQRIEDVIIGVDKHNPVSRGISSSKKNQTTKQDTSSDRFISQIQGYRYDILQVLNFVHQKIKNLLLESGYDKANNYIKAIEEDDKDRIQLLKENYESLLNSEFSFIPQISDIYLNDPSIFDATKDGIIEKEEVRSAMGL